MGGMKNESTINAIVIELLFGLPRGFPGGRDGIKVFAESYGDLGGHTCSFLIPGCWLKYNIMQEKVSILFDINSEEGKDYGR